MAKTTWRDEWYNYSQNTSLQGISFVTERQHFFWRRVVWLVVVILAFALFLYFVIAQLLYLLSHPRSVDIEMIFNGSISFPAVTICNQNYFRRTAAHTYGLIDMIEEAYIHDGDTETHDANSTVETVYNGFIVYKNSTLDNIGDSYTAYVGVTVSVCKYLCLDVDSDSCCSILYDWSTRTCQITDLNPSRADGVTQIDQTGFDYLSRKQCEETNETKCDFEVDMCAFVVDQSESVSWEHTEAGHSLDTSPKYDHTHLSGEGHYIEVNTNHGLGAAAKIYSPQIIRTPTSCVKFYYQVLDGILRVQVDYKGEVSTIYTQHAYVSHEWEYVQLEIPEYASYFKVILRASAEDAISTNIHVAVDDFWIGPCDPVPDCKYTLMGLGYMGTANVTQSGKPCVQWLDIPWYRVPVEGFHFAQGDLQMWKEGQLNVWSQELYMDNYCRNTDGYPYGPWCVTDAEALTTELCSIPYCNCSSVEHTCEDGRCLPPHTVCDGASHCSDGSDESGCVLPSLNCTFLKDNNCSYINSEGPYTLKWTSSGKDGLRINENDAMKNDIASLSSPSITTVESSCLVYVMEYQITTNSTPYFEVYTSESQFNNSFVCNSNFSLWGENDENSDLKEMFIDIPGGTYQVVLNLIYDDLWTDFILHETRLAAMPCEEYIFQLGTTATPIMTTEYVTGKTGNATSALKDDEAEATTATVTAAPEILDNTIDSIQNASETEIVSTTDIPNHALTTESYSMTTAPYTACYEAVHVCMTCYQFIATDDPFADVYTFMVSNLGWTFETVQLSDDTVVGDVALNDTMNDTISVGMSSNETKSNETNDTDYEGSYISPNYISDNLDDSPTTGQTVHLITTISTYDNVQCLRFDFKTRYWDVFVYEYNNNTTDEILANLYDGGEPIWKEIWVQVSPGEKGFIFSLVYNHVDQVENQTERTGIDNIRMDNGDCFLTLSVEESSLDCDFDGEYNNGSWCGYNEITDGMPMFFLKYWNNEYGFYLGTTQVTNDKRITKQLQSQLVEVEETSCMFFYYYTQATAADEFDAIVITNVDTDDNEEVIWTLHGVSYLDWQYSKVQIEPGTLRINLKIVGQNMYGGFDNITLRKGTCDENEEIVCGMDYYKCQNTSVCIRIRDKCNSITNCMYGDDEEPIENCYAAFDLFEDDEEMEAPDLSDSDPLFTYASMNQSGTNLALDEMYYKVGHQGNNFIYECSWEGKPCSFANFTADITDFGMCYTFNGDIDTRLMTSSTGAKNGLQLTLNIEQYEYMAGPQTDAGIKAYLYSQWDIPQVLDLGFAMSAGDHALVGVARIDAEYLEEPWGDCGYKDLRFYPEYGFSECGLECITIDTERNCSCRDAYMPKDHDGLPQLCNLTEYFDCLVPISTTSIECQQCPKPCYQSLFTPSLSYVAISLDSIDQILKTGQGDIGENYHKALEYKQRTESDTFIDDVILFENIIQGYNDLISTVVVYVSSSDSLFDRIFNTSEVGLELIFLMDLNYSFTNDEYLTNMYGFESTFNEYYKVPVEMVHESDEHFEKTLLNMEHGFRKEKMLGSNTNGESLTEELQASLDAINAHIENVQYANITITDLSYTDILTEEQQNYLPYSYFVDTEICDTMIQKYYEDLTSAKILLEGILQEPTEEKYREDIGFVQNVSNDDEAIHECFDIYGEHLAEVIRWIEEEVQFAEDKLKDEGPSSYYDFEKSSEDIRNDRDRINDAFNKYKYNIITKMELYESFYSSADGTPEINLQSFTDSLRTSVSDEVRRDVTTMKSDLDRMYTEFMDNAVVMDPHMKPYFFHDSASKMILWKLPYANLDFPERYGTEEREIYDIWARSVPTETFTRESSSKYIGEGLDNYYDPLVDTIDEFSELLTYYETKLLNDLGKVDADYDAYKELVEIDTDFVSDNFIRMDVFYQEIKYQHIEQQKAYGVLAFLSELGGYLGLLLGASGMIIFELLDVVVNKKLKDWYGNPADDEPENNDDNTKNGHINLAVEMDNDTTNL